MGSLALCQQLGVPRCGPGAQGFCLDFVFCFFFPDGVITSAYTLGVTVRSVALRRDQLSPSHWPVVAVA